MAKAISPLFSSISGNLGGIEVAMTSNGMILKRRKPPRSMHSRNEIAARLGFAKNSIRWNALTASQVRAFDAYAANHPASILSPSSKPSTGRAAFLRLRVPTGPDYDPFVEVLPPTVQTLPIHTIIATIFEGGPYWLFTFTDMPATDNMVQSLWVARFQSRTETHKPQRWLPIDTVLYDGADSDFYSHFTAARVELVAGEHIALKYVLRAPDHWPSQARTFWITVQERIHTLLKCDDDNAFSHVVDNTFQHNATLVDPTGSDHTQDHSVPGHIGNALYLDGVDDSIIISAAKHYPVMAAGTDFTVALWWKCDSPGPATALHFLSNYLNTSEGLLFYTQTDLFKTAARVPDGGGVKTFAVVWPGAVDNDWHHWCFKRKGTVWTFYKDGIPSITDDDPLNAQALADPARVLAIGSKFNTGNYAPGTADEFRLYDYALSDPQIAALAAM